jgi:hypothetical protein
MQPKIAEKSGIAQRLLDGTENTPPYPLACPFLISQCVPMKASENESKKARKKQDECVKNKRNVDQKFWREV